MRPSSRRCAPTGLLSTTRSARRAAVPGRVRPRAATRRSFGDLSSESRCGQARTRCSDIEGSAELGGIGQPPRTVGLLQPAKPIDVPLGRWASQWLAFGADAQPGDAREEGFRVRRCQPPREVLAGTDEEGAEPVRGDVLQRVDGAHQVCFDSDPASLGANEGETVGCPSAVYLYGVGGAGGQPVRARIACARGHDPHRTEAECGVVGQLRQIAQGVMTVGVCCLRGAEVGACTSNEAVRLVAEHGRVPDLVPELHVERDLLGGVEPHFGIPGIGDD